jgi:hypothetical protein
MFDTVFRGFIFIVRLLAFLKKFTYLPHIGSQLRCHRPRLVAKLYSQANVQPIKKRQALNMYSYRCCGCHHINPNRVTKTSYYNERFQAFQVV